MSNSIRTQCRPSTEIASANPVLEACQSNQKAVERVQAWLDGFNSAIADPSMNRLQALFLPDSHWREILSLSWKLTTTSGRDAIAGALVEALPRFQARDFVLDARCGAPRLLERAGVPVIEAFLRFETAVGRGRGLLRLRRDGDENTAGMAWTLHTTLEEIRGHEEATLRAKRKDPVYARSFHGPTWLERRTEAAQFNDREPTVLIIGGGHAGLGAAACLGQLGIDTLVVDREQRIGDNWRLRYRALMLHNQFHSNHLPYMQFPATWQPYLPKDRMANWLEMYVDCMDINFWTQTSFEGAEFDETSGRWTARLRRGNEVRTLRPKHIIMATSVSGTPRIPKIPTLERFAGKVLHSSQYEGGANWHGRKVLIIGTGTSAHDIAQDLHGHGAHPTLVQRSPTLVVQIEPSAQLYEGVYLDEGPPLEDRDLISTSMPLPVTLELHKSLTAKGMQYDRPLHEALSKVGFRLTDGVNGTGWPYLFRTRGGGYYFNIGCSDLVARGEVGLIQNADIESFVPEGVQMTDGSTVKADLVVLATGYMGLEYMAEKLFGPEVAAKVGPIWGFDPNTQELRNMWSRTGQKGLWFSGGAFSMCRPYSKYMALQILASELGLVSETAQSTLLEEAIS